MLRFRFDLTHQSRVQTTIASADRMEEEDTIPSKTFYYNALTKSFARLFDKSSQACHTFLVPVLTSLPPRIDIEFVKTHVLTPSPYFKDEFVTLNGKVVVIKGKDVACRQGFRYPRDVKVLGEETSYNENFESFRLILTSAPLVGRIRTKNSLEQQARVSARPKRKMALARRRLGEHKKCISSHLDSKAINVMMGSLQEFVNHFRQNYVIVKGFVDDAAQKCKTRCQKALEAVWTGSRNPANEHRFLEILVAAESLVQNALHRKIFQGICTLYKEEDSQLFRSLETMQAVEEARKTLRERIGVRIDLHFNPSRAVERLKELNCKSITTPLAKLCCLYDVQEIITASVSSSSQTSKSFGEVLAADDVLPLVAYVIALAGDQHWCSNLEYLKNFSPDSKVLSSIDAGGLSYQLANFQAAIDLLKKIVESEESSNSTNGRSVSSGENHLAPSKQFSPKGREEDGNMSGALPRNYGHQKHNYDNHHPVDSKEEEEKEEGEGFTPLRTDEGKKGRSTPSPPSLQQGGSVVKRAVRRGSRIREGGSSARDRALRRLQKQEKMAQKQENISKSRSGSKYAEEIDRALERLGISSNYVSDSSTGHNNGSNSSSRRSGINGKSVIRDRRRRSRLQRGSSTIASSGTTSLVHDLLARDEEVLAGENKM